MSRQTLGHAAAQLQSVVAMSRAPSGGGGAADLALRRSVQLLSQVQLQSPEVRGDWRMSMTRLHGEFARFFDRQRAAPADQQRMEGALGALQQGWLQSPATLREQAGTQKDKWGGRFSPATGTKPTTGGGMGLKSGLGWKMTPAGLKYDAPGQGGDGNAAATMIDAVFALQWGISTAALCNGEAGSAVAGGKAATLSKVAQAASFAAAVARG